VIPPERLVPSEVSEPEVARFARGRVRVDVQRDRRLAVS
jgi:hypothetical protein